MKVISLLNHLNYCNLGNYNGFLITKSFRPIICYIKNGLIHNKNGPAVKRSNNSVGWYYKGKYYGCDDTFTIKSWKQQIRAEKLKIFK